VASVVAAEPLARPSPKVSAIASPDVIDRGGGVRPDGRAAPRGDGPLCASRSGSGAGGYQWPFSYSIPHRFWSVPPQKTCCAPLASTAALGGVPIVPAKSSGEAARHLPL